MFQAYRHVHRKLPEKLDESAYQQYFVIRQASSNGHDVSYYCELCDTTLPTSLDVTRHYHATCNSASLHRSRVQTIHDMQKNHVIMSCALLQRRMDGIVHQASIMHVQSKLYWILMNFSVNSGDRNDTEYQALMAEADALVGRYERNERFHLVELAAWKAVCISNPSASVQASTLG
jgi:hypothetical protein